MSKKNHVKRKSVQQAEPPRVATRVKLGLLITGLIVAFTLFIFSKSIHFQFVNWDDTFYITDNDLIKDLSPEGIRNIITTPVLGMYNPIPFFVYALEFKLAGLDPKIFHFFNLLFHLIACVVLYRFLFKLTGRYETAAIVTLFFAIHPMHVSVVTWVSQTKTSLYFIFYILALGWYMSYVREHYKIKYLFYTLLFFLMAVLSKPSAVTLAPMLFLLDYYLARKMDRKLFLEKVPFFIISIFFGVLTLLTHSESNDSIFEVSHHYSLLNNILIANYSVVFYINKLFMPLNLSLIYPYPPDGTYLPLAYYLSALVIPLIFVLIYFAGKFRKEMIFGFLFFLISISVVVRLVPSGFFFASNQYSYMSYTGLFFILAQYVTYVLDNKFVFATKIKTYVIATLLLFTLFFSYRSTIRVERWQNSLTLFDDVIRKSPKIPVAYNNRALAKKEAGDALGALADFGMALSLDPTYYEAYSNRGLLKSQLWKLDEAMQDFNQAIKIQPQKGAAYFNRSAIKLARRDKAGALEDLRKADSLGITLAHKQIEILTANTDTRKLAPDLSWDETKPGAEAGVSMIDTAD